MSDARNGSGAASKFSRRKFLASSAATVAGAAAASSSITLLGNRAEAFLNAGAFWKRQNTGNGQTSNGYTIGQSLRFNGNSNSLIRTPTSTGNRKTWTLSFWIKISSWADYRQVYYVHNGSATGTDCIQIQKAGTASEYKWAIQVGNETNAYHTVMTTAVYRDPSAWYHVVLAVDTTQGAASDRIKLYMNGTLQSFASAPTVPQNFNCFTNSTVQHDLGSRVSYWFDGYLAEVNLIDGYAYDATYFGQIDSNTGQWIPKSYSGTYGANGFYLSFADASNTTAATLGKDTAAIGGAHTVANNWTPTNFNAYDQMLDSPTNNFCSLNLFDTYVGESLGEGSLLLKDNGTIAWMSSSGTIGMSSGKWYWEFQLATGPYTQSGIKSSQGTYLNLANATGNQSWSWAYVNSNGNKANNDSHVAYGEAYDTSHVIGVAFDRDNGKLYFSKNGVWQASGNPVTQVNPAYSGLSSDTYFAVVSKHTPSTMRINFGQGGQSGLTYDSASGGRFKYTPPTGFKALCAVNLSVPTIKNPSQYFSVVTRAGNGTSISPDPGFATGLLWIKNRSAAQDHVLVDPNRVSSGWATWLNSNTTNIEATAAGAISFPSSGYSITSGDSRVNASGNNYVDFAWKKGATPGFDIVTYTGNGSASRLVSHSLGVSPAFAIVKNRSASSNWWVWHKAYAIDGYMFLNSTAAATTTGFPWGTGTWSQTQFMVNTGTENANVSGNNYIAYLWAEVAGFSKFGSYTANGSVDGPFVYCGFKPRFLMIKRIDAVDSWVIEDSARNTGNPDSAYVLTDQALAEGSTTIRDLLSNGFKVRSAAQNISGGTYIFAAFAEAPFKYATAR